MRRIFAALAILAATTAGARAATVTSAVPWTQTDYTSNTATLALPATNYLYETIAQGVPAALTIQLPSAPATGTFQCIKDRNNNFQTFNATVVTTDSSTVDMVAGATGYVMNRKGQSNCFRFNAAIGANGNWIVSLAYNANSPAGLFNQIMSAPPTATATGYTTWINQGTATETDNSFGMSFTLQSQQNVHQVRALIKTAPATPYTTTILLVWGGAPTQYWDTNALLGWYDGMNAIDAVAINPYSGTLSFSRNTYASPTAPVNAPTPNYSCSIWDQRPSGPCSYSTMQQIFPPSSMLWVKLANDGTTGSIAASLDGENYQTLWSFPVVSGYLSSGYKDLLIGGDAHFAQAQFTIASYADASTAVAYAGPLDVITANASGYQCYSVEPCSIAIGTAGTTAALNVTNSTPVTCDLVVGLSSNSPTLKTAASCGTPGVAAATFCGTSCTVNTVYDQKAIANCSAAACNFTSGAISLVFAGCPGTVPYCLSASNSMNAASQTFTATLTINGVWESTTTTDEEVLFLSGLNTQYRQNTAGGSPTPSFSIFNGTNQVFSSIGVANNAWHSATGSYNTTTAAFLDVDNSVVTAAAGGTGTGAGSANFYMNSTNVTSILYTEILLHPTAAISQSDATALCHNQSVRFGLSLAC